MKKLIGFLAGILVFLLAFVINIIISLYRVSAKSPTPRL